MDNNPEPIYSEVEHKKEIAFHKWISNVLLLVLVASILLFAYLLWWPVTIINIRSAHVVTPVVSAGQSVGFDFSYCKNKDIPGVVYRFFVEKDSQRVNINIPVAATVSIPGCHQTRIYAQLPAGIPQGEYILKGVNSYKYNGLRTLNYPWQTDNSFIVK